METEINPTEGTLAGDAQLTSADGAAAVDSSTLTLAEMNQVLGKDFKDKESALKALKDTQSYVGKRKEDIAAEIRANNTVSAPQEPDSSLKSEVQLLKDELFYTQNPQFKDIRDVITSMGSNPAEVVNSDAFKKVFEKIQVADKVEQTRSVVSSSPRLAQSKSVVDNAIQVANARGTTVGDIAETLARGLIEAEG